MFMTRKLKTGEIRSGKGHLYIASCSVVIRELFTVHAYNFLL